MTAASLLFLDSQFCSLRISVSELEFIQGDFFIVVSNDDFIIFIEQIDFFDSIICGEPDTPDADGRFFLLRDFADIEPQEDAPAGAQSDMGGFTER